MIRKTDDKLEKDLWDLGDIQSGRYIEIEQAKERPMEYTSGGIRDYTPKYFPKPRINELLRVIQTLTIECQQLISLRYIGLDVNNICVPLEINALSVHMKWSRRKTFSKLKEMKALIRDKMPIYTPLTFAPKGLKYSYIKYSNTAP